MLSNNLIFDCLDEKDKLRWFYIFRQKSDLDAFGASLNEGHISDLVYVIGENKTVVLRQVHKAFVGDNDNLLFPHAKFLYVSDREGGYVIPKSVENIVYLGQNPLFIDNVLRFGILNSFVCEPMNYGYSERKTIEKLLSVKTKKLVVDIEMSRVYVPRTNDYIQHLELKSMDTPYFINEMHKLTSLNHLKYTAMDKHRALVDFGMVGHLKLKRLDFRSRSMVSITIVGLDKLHYLDTLELVCCNVQSLPPNLEYLRGSSCFIGCDSVKLSKLKEVCFECVTVPTTFMESLYKHSPLESLSTDDIFLFGIDKCKTLKYLTLLDVCEIPTQLRFHPNLEKVYIKKEKDIDANLLVEAVAEGGVKNISINAHVKDKEQIMKKYGLKSLDSYEPKQKLIML